MLVFLIYFFAGYFNCWCDYINSNPERYATTLFYRFKNQQWWDISKSSGNKWKNGLKANGEAFFGSTTFLVAITDAWHCFKGLVLLLFAAATGYAFVFGSSFIITLAGLGVNLQNVSTQPLYLIIIVQILVACFGLGFQISEKTIVVKKS